MNASSRLLGMKLNAIAAVDVVNDTRKSLGKSFQEKRKNRIEGLKKQYEKMNNEKKENEALIFSNKKIKEDMEEELKGLDSELEKEEEEKKRIMELYEKQFEKCEKLHKKRGKIVSDVQEREDNIVNLKVRQGKLDDEQIRIENLIEKEEGIEEQVQEEVLYQAEEIRKLMIEICMKKMKGARFDRLFLEEVSSGKSNIVYHHPLGHVTYTFSTAFMRETKEDERVEIRVKVQGEWENEEMIATGITHFYTSSSVGDVGKANKEIQELAEGVLVFLKKENEKMQ